MAELLALGEVTKAVPFDNPALFAWRRFAVDGLLRLGRTDEARTLADEELEIARRWGARHEIGASLRARGLVEGGAEGRRLLEEAVEMFDGTEAQLQHARALIDLGAAYRRDGQRTKAREVLTRGVDLALRTGVLGLVERGNEELAATGARPRKSLVTGLDALTPSERRVAELAADDLTNKEIAQALFVTVKTVEVHLSSAYRKLQLNSRRELAAALAARYRSLTEERRASARRRRGRPRSRGRTGTRGRAAARGLRARRARRPRRRVRRAARQAPRSGRAAGRRSRR